jgi:G:T-mismatch repair DNA endonuclease (very short patch repair protein)
LVRFCSINGCKNIHDAKGFCQNHYRRLKIYGNPLYVPNPKIKSKKLSNIHKGKKLSEETKQKLRIVNLGKKQSEETIRKRAEKLKGNKWNVGKKQSEETIRKRISKVKGQRRTIEQKKRMSEAQKGINLGKKHSETTKKKISEALKEHTVSEETRRKIGAKHKGKKLTLEQRKKISEVQKGRKQSEETVRKRAESNRGKKRSKEFSENLSKRMKGKIVSALTRKKQSEKRKVISNRTEVKQKQREVRAKQKFPFKDSKPEVLTQSILEKNNIRFVKHKNFKLSNSYHQADITIEPDKVIEVNGDYWHFNPKKYDGESIVKVRRNEVKVKEVWKHDKRIINEMKEQGYKVLVVWESELKDDLDKISKKILKFAKS